MAWWDSLNSYSDFLTIEEFGTTDAGYPLHLAILSTAGDSLASIKQSGKNIILINNAIHPGEPDGVDASMALFRKICMSKNPKELKNTILVCIPFYNIGGALNRNSSSRANQQGPEEYGFRGNAQNLDLNRDFIKCDSKNAKSFAALLQLLDPDIYIETHVSNGADYQYTMTYLCTQTDKLGFGMGKFTDKKMNPGLEASMANKGFPMVPYVNVHGTALENSYTAFYDSPRFSTGLATLHQCFSYITESHMLKPYDDRVRATLAFLESIIEFNNANYKMVRQLRKNAKKKVANTEVFVLDWEVDSSRSIHFNFDGYEHKYIPSLLRPADLTIDFDEMQEARLFYDREKPIRKAMTYYAYFKPSIVRTKPKYYIIPRGYSEVIERLRLNGVQLDSLDNDTSIEVASYTITSYETVDQAFEKHYLHSNTSMVKDTLLWKFLKGDYIIKLGNSKDRFLVEVLEPDAPDSYFNWNFFDAILQQKEWYSPYVFEDIAVKLIEEDSLIAEEFSDMWNTAPGFSQNRQWQLHWVYTHSPYYEKEHMRLPVFRIE